MQIKRYQKNIIKYLFCLTPIFDAINGYCIRHYDYYGVGAKYHLLLIMFLFLMAYFKRKRRIGKMEKYLFCLVFAFFFSFIINYVIDGTYESISIERAGKILCTAIIITCLFRLNKEGILSKTVLKQIVRFQCFFIPVLTLLADVTKIGNYTYDTAKSGMIGFYTGRNEPVVVFTIVACILLHEIYYTSADIGTILLYVMTLLCLLFVQSKMGYLLVCILTIMFFGKYVKELIISRRIRITHVAIGMPVILCGIVIGLNIFKNTISTFILRQAYQREYLMESGVINFLSSGRTSRFSALLINDKGKFVTIIKTIFGYGFRYSYSEMFEMDLFDVFLYGGLISSYLIIALILHAVKRIRRSKKVVIFLGGGLIFLYSFVAGHVWTGGVSGLYFGLVLVYFSSCSEREKEEIKGENINNFIKRYTK